jgi:hypothetical protein
MHKMENFVTAFLSKKACNAWDANANFLVN